MVIAFEEFEKVMANCFEVFSTWDDEYDKLQGNEVYIFGHILSGPSMKHDRVKIDPFSIILCPKI